MSATRSPTMTKLIPAALASTLATVSTLATFALIPYSVRAETAPLRAETVAPAVPAKQAPAKPAAGQMLYDSAGRSIGPVYSLGRNGSVMLLIDDKVVVVPASSLSR